MPLTVRHDNEGQPTDHREIHNVYGMLMTRATYEGLLRLRPERAAVRAHAARRSPAAQRYAAIWPGDNVSDWDHLRGDDPHADGAWGCRASPFVGSDIGGFAEAPDRRAVHAMAAARRLLPVHAHAHHVRHARPGAVVVRDRTTRSVNRRAIELRYELLPHIYNVMREASETGLPAFRPLLLELPGDSDYLRREDQFMFGADLLVAPVLREGATEREVYLPKGDWYDFWTGQRHSGGTRIRVPVTLASLPIFVRAGAFLFRQPVVQHTGEMPGQPLRLGIFPGPATEATLYEDDGETLDYTRGGSSVRQVGYEAGDRVHTVEIGAPSGSYRPAARSLEVSIPWKANRRVVVIGNDQARDPRGVRRARFAVVGLDDSQGLRNRAAARLVRRDAHQDRAMTGRGSLMSQARPSAFSVRIPIQLKSISYQASPWRALVGWA